MKKLALLAALTAASLSTTAFAAEGNGGFIRAELGQTRAKFDDFGTVKDRLQHPRRLFLQQQHRDRRLLHRPRP